MKRCGYKEPGSQQLLEAFPQIIATSELPLNRSWEAEIFEWFNKQVHGLAAVGAQGTSGRNNLQGRSAINLGVSLRNRFSIAEGRSMGIRVDFFNLPNHHKSKLPRGEAQPTADWGASTGGAATASADSRRSTPSSWTLGVLSGNDEVAWLVRYCLASSVSRSGLLEPLFNP